jgi:hypothetical protein
MDAMDTNAMFEELLDSRLIVVCTHECWAEVVAHGESWVCEAGYEHEVFPALAAGSEWEAAFAAWCDAMRSQDPASAAEFRRCQRELINADLRVRREIGARSPRKLAWKHLGLEDLSRALSRTS